MVSKEYIHSIVKSHHVILVHMKGEKSLDGLSKLIYIIHDLVLDENEEKQLIMNRVKGINSYGILKVKAVRTSQVDLSIQDSEPQEYSINTSDIIDYEMVNN